ncbi:Hypothetical protein SMAX5B_014666 [Scophthalmus maximus]|uniref:Uncharacterized protein n=1 Tax=Scophthalmus maximus TaxID=52904 RepID=A0A2U9C349_SCOMX|nr:Hypothetical protein SMAX5B_014666 [Scophthalmus maximus]
MAEDQLAQLQTESDNEIIPLGEQTEYRAGETADVSSHKPACPQDIPAVLREMSTMLAEQRVELRHLQQENEAQAAKLRELDLQKKQQVLELDLQKTQLDKLKQQVQGT